MPFQDLQLAAWEVRGRFRPLVVIDSWLRAPQCGPPLTARLQELQRLAVVLLLRSALPLRSSHWGKANVLSGSTRAGRNGIKNKSLCFAPLRYVGCTTDTSCQFLQDKASRVGVRGSERGESMPRSRGTAQQ